MHRLRNLLLICFLLPLVVLAQDDPESSVAPARPQDQRQMFVVELTEIEDCSADQLANKQDLDAEQLLRESKKHGSHRQRNAFRISAIEGTASYALFGKQVPAVVAWTITDGKTEFTYENEHVGTELIVVVSRVDETQVKVQLAFTSSEITLQPDGTKDNVDVIVATETHTVELGEPVIVDQSHQYTEKFEGGDSETLSDKSSLLILSVEAAEQDEAFNRRLRKRLK